MFVASVVR